MESFKPDINHLKESKAKHKYNKYSTRYCKEKTHMTVLLK